MSVIPARNSNGDLPHRDEDLRGQSALTSSNPATDSLPIDCILVYDQGRDTELETTIDVNRKQRLRPSELRQNFEDYLRKRQGLMLTRVVSENESACSKSYSNNSLGIWSWKTFLRQSSCTIPNTISYC